MVSWSHHFRWTAWPSRRPPLPDAVAYLYTYLAGKSSRGVGCDGNLVAQALDASDGAIHGRDLVAVVKIVAPEIFVDAAFGEQVIRDDENAVCDCDSCTVGTPARRDAPVLSRQVTPSRTGCRAGRLSE